MKAERQKKFLRTMWKKQLCPFLNFGDIVIMDNLSAHKSSKVIKLIEACAEPRFYIYLPTARTSILLKKCGVK